MSYKIKRIVSVFFLVAALFSVALLPISGLPITVYKGRRARKSCLSFRNWRGTASASWSAAPA
jgi:hypothetical protein